jgi:hypothetical protein
MANHSNFPPAQQKSSENSRMVLGSLLSTMPLWTHEKEINEAAYYNFD